MKNTLMFDLSVYSYYYCKIAIYINQDYTCKMPES